MTVKVRVESLKSWFQFFGGISPEVEILWEFYFEFSEEEPH
jgi:hypothetical protein